MRLVLSQNEQQLLTAVVNVNCVKDNVVTVKPQSIAKTRDIARCLRSLAVYNGLSDNVTPEEKALYLIDLLLDFSNSLKEPVLGYNMAALAVLRKIYKSFKHEIRDFPVIPDIGRRALLQYQRSYVKKTLAMYDSVELLSNRRNFEVARQQQDKSKHDSNYKYFIMGGIVVGVIVGGGVGFLLAGPIGGIEGAKLAYIAVGAGVAGLAVGGLAAHGIWNHKNEWKDFDLLRAHGLLKKELHDYTKELIGTRNSPSPAEQEGEPEMGPQGNFSPRPAH